MIKKKTLNKYTLKKRWILEEEEEEGRIDYGITEKRW